MTDKNNNNSDDHHPLIIESEEKEIQDQRPPNIKIISYNLINKNSEN